MDEQPQRRAIHQRNEALEEILGRVNRLLGDVETQAVASFREPAFPVLLIIGTPRSGTTFLLQWLASTGRFSYPTNLLSRFYGAPYIGALIQEMLTTHDFRRELFDLAPEVGFESRLGKTRGALAPNEFWYFWRRFFRFGDIQKLSEDELSKVDVRTFLAEIAALESVFGKPFVMKGMIAQWNLVLLDRIFPRIVFLHIRRRPLDNVRSLLEARRDYFGDERAWYSFKPPQYPDLLDLEPVEQVTAQVYWTSRAIQEGLAPVSVGRKLVISYEKFCKDPVAVWGELAKKVADQGYQLGDYTGPRSFEVGDRGAMLAADRHRVAEKWSRLSGEEMDP